MPDPQAPGPTTEESSLENPPEAGSTDSSADASQAPGSGGFFERNFLSSRRLVLLTGVIMIVIALIILVGVLTRPNKKGPSTIIVNTQSLDNGTLNKLAAQLNSKPAQQQLTITPSTLFKNDVNVQGNLLVKGTSNLGAVITSSDLAVHGGLSVAGSTSFGGNVNVSGQLSAASLSVGSVSVGAINLTGNLTIGGHLVPNGASPSVKASVGASGGSATITGTDTAGTVTITTGNGTLIAGEMAIISFKKPFNLTPKVQLTPVNADSANLRYYVSQSATFFTVQSAATPASDTVYTFNYFVTQ